MSSVQLVRGPSPAQKAGIDKFVILEGGKKISVDEKVRRNRRPDDILLEHKHVPVGGGAAWPGWIAKPNQHTDFLAYGFPSHQTAFFFPFLTLATAWHRHGEVWVSKFSIPPSPNPRDVPRYHTHNVCIPTEILMGYLLDAIRVKC